MPLMIDFRLLELSMDISTLESHIDLIEKQIVQGEEAAEREFQDRLRESNAQGEDQWDLLHQEKYFRVEFVLPRVLRGPFLVTLFSVYETAMTEIAKLIQARRGIQSSLDDRRGDLLRRAKKYYSNVPDFELSKDNQHWERLTQLSDLRNAIAHSNGRLNMIRPITDKEKLLKIDGVNDRLGYIVVDKKYLEQTFKLVKAELEGLVARYKKWDTENRAPLHTKG